MKLIKIVIYACFALSLAACSGSDLSIDGPGGDARTVKLEFPPGRAVEHQLPLRISGGIPPYDLSIQGCPEWVTLFPGQGILAGSAPATDLGKTFFCSYLVTDSTVPTPQSTSLILRLAVGSPTTLTPFVPLVLPSTPDQEFFVGTYGSVRLPAASGGVGPYEYSFTCAGGTLPSGMGFAAETRVFAGTPDEAFRDSCAYTVTDSSRPAETVSQPIQVTVVGSMTPLVLPSTPDQEFSVGTYGSVTLPAASGGVGLYEYSFACAGGTLPSGMGFAPETRVIAGTPDRSFRDSCVYSVTDSSQPAAKVSQAIQVTVAGSMTPLVLPSVPDQEFFVGTYGSVTLPAASGGIGPYRYSFACAGGRLPSGMGFAPETRVLAGTPDESFRDSCVYSVADSSRPAAMVSQPIQVTVVGSMTPLVLPSTPDQDFIVDTYGSVTLPAASGGVGPYRYSFTCAGGRLPSGMGFAAETSVIAGTPGEAFRDSCVYSVTDSSQPAATVSHPIQVTVVGSMTPLVLPSTPDQDFIVDTYGSVTLPAASGGVGPYRYSFTCAGGRLPSGMGFAAETRVFAGTPGEAFRDSCVYSVTDSSRPTAKVSQAIQVTVVDSMTPPLALPIAPDQDFVVGTYSSVTLPAASGGVWPYRYSFSCANGRLPSGMGFAAETRVIAGTPGESFRDSCVYSVTDSSQPAAKVSHPIQVTVAGSMTPLVLPIAPDQEFVVGTYSSVTLPAASGGVWPYSYFFSCAGGRLPSGMGFAAETRVLAGTPDEAFRDSCVYSVTDSSQPVATVSHPIEVTVAGSMTPLVLPIAPDQEFVVGTYSSVTLPAASGGVWPYTYSFSCAGGRLPSGMGFAAATRVIAGTPGEAFRDSCVYSVTDSSQPAATVSQPVQVTVAGSMTPLVLPSAPDQEFVVGTYSSVILPAASGGVGPYTYSFACVGGSLPSGMGFAPATRVFAGTPDESFRDSCVYSAMDSSRPAATVSQSIQMTVDPHDLRTWRFHTRTVAESEHPLERTDDVLQPFVTLPHAIPGTGVVADTETYELLDIQSPLEFAAATRQLSYRHTGVDPLFETPTTFRYQVFSADDEVQDALCVDVSYRDLRPRMNGPDGLLDTVAVRIRDDAYWDATRGEYQCPGPVQTQASSSRATVSNPVHSALAPVHARRAVDAAHAAIRDRVRGWSQGDPNGFAISPSVDFASLSGLSGGFDYTGTSESLRGGVEIGADSWQAGLIASLTRTDLRYHAQASLSERGYRAGEHDTEILSVHPYAAWHAASGGHLWASLGAGLGDLRHRDDLGFPSWSRSGVRFRAYALGASVPLAEVLSGELDAEADIESFVFEIEGGDRISTSLPTLRGRDYRAGLAWSAPVPGAPFVSVAYKQSTGDGPEGARVEAQGSASVAGFLDPRLTLTGSAETTFGLGDYEQDSWRLGGGIHFAPDGLGRGFELDLDARLMSLADGGSAGIGMRGKAGYGLWSETFLGIVRPYVGLIRYPGDRSVRRALGLDLLDTPTSQVSVEIYDHSRDLSRAVELTLHHRF